MTVYFGCFLTEIHGTGSNKDKLNQEQQNAAKVISNWENE